MVPAGHSSSQMDWNMSPMACATFNDLRLEGKLCDAIISVDGTEFKAHKNILCSCSRYFRALFTSGWDNAEKTVYKIPGTSPEMMKIIIEYAYTRTVPITADNAEALLMAAHQFNVMGMVRLCCEFLKSQLCSENCISIWRLTDHYYCPNLREAASIFILHHFQEMTTVSTEFLDLSVNELKNIIEKDELNVKEEAAVFEALVKWIAHDPQNRRQHTAVLLSKVRLALMQVDYFFNNVKRHQFVKDNKECRGLLLKTLTTMYNLNMHGPSCSDYTNPLSRPRLPYAILFATGGWSRGSPTNAIETYDGRANKWVNVTCEQASPVAYHGTAYLKGFIYIIGGFDSMDYFSSVKRFDLLSKTWQQVGPMHSRRCYISVTVLNDTIYAMGGFNGRMRLNTAERYEPETNQWTLIATMHEQRSDASATTLHEKVGGFNGVNWLQTVEAYSPVANEWHAVPSMLSPRSNFGVEVVDDRLFAVGGFNGFTTTFKAEYYDEKDNAWHDVQNMGINRSALSCCVVPGLPNIREYVAR